MTIVLEEQLADRFAAVLREWLTPGEWEAMRAANGAETDPGICHSHDYCDANMAMHQAFSDHAPELMSDGVVGEDAVPVWNTAWEIAMRRHLR